MLTLPNGGVLNKRLAKAQLKSLVRLVADFINTIGQKRKWRLLRATSAVLPITNIHRRADVGIWPPVYEFTLSIDMGASLTIFLS